MQLSSTSGFGCCGVRTLGGIYPYMSETSVYRGGRTEKDRASIKERMEYLKKFQKELTSSSTGESKCIIAVLADYEIIQDLGLAKEMKNQGWKLVHRFKNPTGSMCNVLVWTAKKSRPMRGAQSPWYNL